MTPQERELLGAFLQQMTQAQAGQKDADAEALIRDASARQPDALYLLVQRAMGLEYALGAAQAQAAKLQSELDQSRQPAASSFLDPSNAWGRQAPAANAAQAPVANAAQTPLASAAAPRSGAQPARAPTAPASSWGSGMLGGIATTAAGVVAGSFLFQGIQGMMGHHNQPANAAANVPPSPPEPAKVAAAPEEEADELDDSTDYADASGGDSDSGDSA